MDGNHRILPQDMSEEEMSNGMWEDRDTRLFYESLIDVKAVMPAIVFAQGAGV